MVKPKAEAANSPSGFHRLDKKHQRIFLVTCLAWMLADRQVAANGQQQIGRHLRRTAQRSVFNLSDEEVAHYIAEIEDSIQRNPQIAGPIGLVFKVHKS
ncbi:hypothetical protein B9T16_18955 [Arthrospira sp. PCC 8006]|uniref:hypothetical protein n=1 Tax=Arthrospira sp. PCC 8006 TaxID=1982224 RepID=UPI00396E7E26